jgi:hypothetical protein
VLPTRVDLPGDLVPSIFPSRSVVGGAAAATPTPGPALDLANFPIVFGRDDALIAALEPAETAVWCCPQYVPYSTLSNSPSLPRRPNPNFNLLGP